MKIKMEIEMEVKSIVEFSLDETQHNASGEQNSTVQYGAVQYNTVKYSTVKYSTARCSTVQYSTIQYSTVSIKMNAVNLVRSDQDK